MSGECGGCARQGWWHDRSKLCMDAEHRSLEAIGGTWIGYARRQLPRLFSAICHCVSESVPLCEVSRTGATPRESEV